MTSTSSDKSFLLLLCPSHRLRTESQTFPSISHQLATWASHSYIEATVFTQESDLSLGIGPDQGKDDCLRSALANIYADISLLTLQSINCADSHLWKLLVEQRGEKRCLSLIGSHDANFHGWDAQTDLTLSAHLKLPAY